LGATFQAMGSRKDKNNANFIILNPSINKEDIFDLYIFYYNVGSPILKLQPLPNWNISKFVEEFINKDEVFRSHFIKIFANLSEKLARDNKVSIIDKANITQTYMLSPFVHIGQMDSRE
jgi:hypothetical protein